MSPLFCLTDYHTNIDTSHHITSHQSFNPNSIHRDQAGQLGGYDQ